MMWASKMFLAFVLGFFVCFGLLCCREIVLIFFFSFPWFSESDTKDGRNKWLADILFNASPDNLFTLKPAQCLSIQWTQRTLSRRHSIQNGCNDSGNGNRYRLSIARQFREPGRLQVMMGIWAVSLLPVCCFTCFFFWMNGTKAGT